VLLHVLEDSGWHTERRVACAHAGSFESELETASGRTLPTSPQQARGFYSRCGCDMMPPWGGYSGLGIALAGGDCWGENDRRVDRRDGLA
jgi:hypothetical protein